MVDKAIPEFDKYLEKKGLFFKGTIIGGAALLILEISERQTKDVDCLSPQIPPEIKEASREFANEHSSLKLDPDWLNNGPQTLLDNLPKDWRTRLSPLFLGSSLNLTTLGRPDLLKTKLFAFCDRTDPDFSDLLRLKPTEEELNDSIDWVKKCDANPGWPAHVENMFNNLKEALNESSVS
jgi:hypothetical protein